MARNKRRPEPCAVEPTLSVVIDPGHGGRSPGACWEDPRSGKWLFEKAINLDIARRVVGFLPSHVSYYMTRDEDETINLRNRVLHPWHYDLFVSVHCNAVEKDAENVSGTEVYVHSLMDDWSKDVAHAFVQAVSEAMKIEPNMPNPVRSNPRLRVLALADRIRDRYGRSRSILRRAIQNPKKGARDVGTPAFLIEVGYMTHPVDRKALMSAARHKAVAEAIANVIETLAPHPVPLLADEVPEEE